MKTKKFIHLVVIDDCYDYESKIEVFAFSTHKKASEFYDKKLAEFLKDETSYDDVTNEPGYFLAFDEGWYARDHYEISIQTKEVL